MFRAKCVLLLLTRSKGDAAGPPPPNLHRFYCTLVEVQCIVPDVARLEKDTSPPALPPKMTELLSSAFLSKSKASTKFIF